MALPGPSVHGCGKGCLGVLKDQVQPMPPRQVDSFTEGIAVLSGDTFRLEGRVDGMTGPAFILIHGPEATSFGDKQQASGEMLKHTWGWRGDT